MAITYEDWLNWAKKRETLSPDEDEFWAYTESWERALGLVESLQPWLNELNLRICSLQNLNANEILMRSRLIDF